MNVKYFLLLIFLLPSSFAVSDPLKGALKNLGKGKLEKVEAALNKSLGKDSLNPGAKYLYSLLFVTPEYQHYSVDTANIFIRQAIVDYEQVDEKKLKKLSNLYINHDALFKQKSLVDNMGFALAAQENTINAYNEFLEKYPGAIEINEATRRRNDLAFAEAQKINTYEAYMSFIQTYPEADQVRDAKELYDILIFQNRTSDKTLNSYVDFLKEYPKTPYRYQAEKNIYEIATASNELADYAFIIKNYPKSNFSRKAASHLYYNFIENNPREDFLVKFPDISYKDSIATLIPIQKYALFPILEKDRFGFMDTQGKLILEPAFDDILEDYSCRAIYEDFLVIENGGKKIIGRNGRIIYQDDFDEVEDLGLGILKIKRDDKVLLKHKGGFNILDSLYDDAHLINKKFIVYEDKGKLGLSSLNGKKLFDPQFDDIYTEGDFIVLEKNNNLAIITNKNLIDKANNIPLNLNFKYEEVYPVKENLLQAIGSGFETILNKDLKNVVPEDNHEIIPYVLGWVIKKDDAYSLYDDKMFQISSEPFDKIINNKNWLGIKKGEKWAVINNKNSIFPDFVYDTIKILTSNITLLEKNDSSLALFGNGEILTLPNSQDRIQILKPTILTGTQDTIGNEFMMITNKSNFRRVFDIEGREILSGFYDNISYQGPNLLLLDRKNKKGLADGTGKIVLPLKYDGIGNYNNGFVSTLTGTKFGIFSLTKGVNINPEYEQNLQPYNDQLFVAAKNKKSGLVDHTGKKVTNLIFDQVIYWTDSVAMVKNKDHWNLYHLYNNEILYDEISDFKYIRQDSLENIITIIKNNNYGVLSSLRGEVIPPLYSDIINLGSEKEPVYFSEKNVEEALIFIAIYFNDKGEMIRRQAFTPEEYEKIYCE
ncbi:hypothetical protein BH23BAC1_BH23BAC1_09610 [soil metagenome]